MNIKNGKYTTDSLPENLKNAVLDTLEPGVRELLEVLPSEKSFSHYFNLVSKEKIKDVLSEILLDNYKSFSFGASSSVEIYGTKDINEGFYLAFEKPLTEEQSQYVTDICAYVLGGVGGWRNHIDFSIDSVFPTLIAVSASEEDSQRSAPWYEVNEVLEEQVSEGTPVRSRNTSYGKAGTRAVEKVSLPEFKVIPVNQG